MNSTISFQAEIPEELYNELQRHLDRSSDWDHDRTITAALSLFLMQQRSASPVSSRTYLNTLFSEAT